MFKQFLSLFLDLVQILKDIILSVAALVDLREVLLWVIPELVLVVQFLGCVMARHRCFEFL